MTKENILLSDKELSRKMLLLENSLTHEERLQDKIVDILGFLIAIRDGHRHKLTVGKAIKYLKDIEDGIFEINYRYLPTIKDERFKAWKKGKSFICTFISITKNKQVRKTVNARDENDNLRCFDSIIWKFEPIED